MFLYVFTVAFHFTGTPSPYTRSLFLFHRVSLFRTYDLCHVLEDLMRGYLILNDTKIFHCTCLTFLIVR